MVPVWSRWVGQGVSDRRALHKKTWEVTSSVCSGSTLELGGVMCSMPGAASRGEAWSPGQWRITETQNHRITEWVRLEGATVGLSVSPNVLNQGCPREHCTGLCPDGSWISRSLVSGQAQQWTQVSERHTHFTAMAKIRQRDAAQVPDCCCKQQGVDLAAGCWLP